jgi:hypothetical protein
LARAGGADVCQVLPDLAGASSRHACVATAVGAGDGHWHGWRWVAPESLSVRSFTLVLRGAHRLRTGMHRLRYGCEWVVARHGAEEQRACWTKLLLFMPAGLSQCPARQSPHRRPISADKGVRWLAPVPLAEQAEVRHPPLSCGLALALTLAKMWHPPQLWVSPSPNPSPSRVAAPPPALECSSSPARGPCMCTVSAENLAHGMLVEGHSGAVGGRLAAELAVTVLVATPDSRYGTNCAQYW